jgi:hypothetical protein
MPSNDPIEVAREINDAFSATPFSEIRAVVAESGGLAEANAAFRDRGYVRFADIIHLLDDDISIVETDIEGAETLISRTGSGKDGWWSWFKSWFEPWRELRVDQERYETLADGIVLADCRVQAEGELSGVPTTLEMTQLWQVREGKVVRYGIYSSAAAANDAAAALAEGRPA